MLLPLLGVVDLGCYTPRHCNSNMTSIFNVPIQGVPVDGPVSTEK